MATLLENVGEYHRRASIFRKFPPALPLRLHTLKHVRSRLLCRLTLRVEGRRTVRRIAHLGTFRFHRFCVPIHVVHNTAQSRFARHPTNACITIRYCNRVSNVLGVSLFDRSECNRLRLALVAVCRMSCVSFKPKNGSDRLSYQL